MKDTKSAISSAVMSGGGSSSGDHSEKSFALTGGNVAADGKRMRAEFFFYDLKLVDTIEKLADEEKHSLGISFYATFIDKDARVKIVAARGNEYVLSVWVLFGLCLVVASLLRCSSLIDVM